MRLDVGVSFCFCFFLLFLFCFVAVVVVGVVLPLVIFFCRCFWWYVHEVALLLRFYFVFLSFGFVLFSLYVCIFLWSFLKLSFCQINGNCEIFMGEDQKREVDGKGDFRMKKIHTDKKGQLLSLYWALWRILRA